MKKSQNLTHILERFPNPFLLSVAVAKRARQIKDGSRSLVDSPDEVTTPILTALDEIDNDRLNITILDEIEEDAELLEEISQSLDEDFDDDTNSDDDTDKKKKKNTSKGKTKSLRA